MIFIYKKTEHQLTDWLYRPAPNYLMIRRLIDPILGKPSNKHYIGFRYNHLYNYYVLVSYSELFEEIGTLYLELTKNSSIISVDKLKESQDKLDDFLNRIDKLKIFI